MKKIWHKFISWFRKGCNISITVEKIGDTTLTKNLFSMPVPDKVIFGPNPLGVSLNFGEVRKITDENEKIELLRLRLKNSFIDKVQNIKNSGGAFPLTVMTCLGFETLGDICVKKNKDDHSYQFVKMASKLHQKFSRKFDAAFQKQLKKMWPENKDIQKVDTLAKLLYTYFRNTIFHGFYARGVYLSYEDTASFDRVTEGDEGYLVVNPDWLWSKFVDIFDEAFYEIKLKPNSDERTLCLEYINKMLK